MLAWSYVHLKTKLGLDDLLPRWLTHMTGRLVFAVGRPQFSATWTFPLGCPSVLRTQQLLPPEWMIQENAKWQYNDFYELATGVTLHCVCNILLITKVSPVQSGGKAQEVKTGSHRWLGVILDKSLQITCIKTSQVAANNLDLTCILTSFPDDYIIYIKVWEQLLSYTKMCLSISIFR